MYIITSFIDEQLAIVGILVTIVLWFLFLTCIIYITISKFKVSKTLSMYISIFFSIIILIGIIFILFYVLLWNIISVVTK